jgi:hypothetical protein
MSGSTSKVTPEQRSALIEKYRDINTDYQWWDCTYSDFREDMREVGIAVDRIYFSGFWSQGDGACFEGGFTSVKTYLDHHHQGQYPMIRKMLEHGGYVYVSCKHSGHYCHENCTTFSIEHDTFYHLIECPTEFHEQVADTMDKQLEYEIDDFEKDVIEQFRSYMQDLYRKLEAEYDYRTSDDEVWEAIVANELDDEYEEAA